MTAPVRVFKFLSGFAFGGTEKQALHVLRSLDRTRFEPHVGCLKATGHLTKDFRNEAASFAEYRIRRMYDHTAVRGIFQLTRDLRRRQIDVVHTYGFYGNTFAIPAARLSGARVVVASIRDMGNVWTRSQRLAQRLACSFADCVLVNADAVRKQLVEEGYEAAKIRVIGNGIVMPEANAAAAQTLHEEFHIPSGAPIVAVLAVLRREKGIEYFLEAAKIVLQRFPNARFLVIGDSVYRAPGSDEVVGDGRYREDLERYAQSLGLDGRVIFTGLRFDAPSVLSQISISVLPTLTEALSNTILESMAAGKPVIATNVGGNPEAVIDGTTGLLVPPRDSAALANAIASLLADPQRASRMGAAGRETVRKHFAVDAMVRATEQLYLELLNSGTTTPARVVRGLSPVA